MNGYGSHTFSFLNADDERFWVKFHFKTRQGHKFLTNQESAAVIGQSRETYQEDLYGAIESGDFPKWTLYVQIMPEVDADRAAFNPFDLTKVWPHGDYPLFEVGEMELNRNPDNYFAEIEQAAFSPSNIVPGIGFSPDKMLQARIFSYADAHRHRLGNPLRGAFRSTPRNARCTTITRTGDAVLCQQPEPGTPITSRTASGGPVETSVRRAAAEDRRRRDRWQPSRRQ